MSLTAKRRVITRTVLNEKQRQRYQELAPILSAEELSTLFGIPMINEEIVIKAVCDHFGCSRFILGQRDYNKTLIRARHMACYFLHRYSMLSTTQIASLLNRFYSTTGEPDHSYVTNALKRVNDSLDIQDDAYPEMPALDEKLKPQMN